MKRSPNSTPAPSDVSKIREEIGKISVRRPQNVADIFVEQLAAWGVRYVFGIPGGSILPIVDAVRRSNQIRFILVRHESTAAFMASAYAKLTGKLGVCTAITGAGATNLITGLADAAWDRAPVLAITGQIQQELIGSGFFQEIDQYGLFSSLAVYNESLQEAAQVITVLPEAMRSALVRRGVSHVGIPINLQREAFIGSVTGPGNTIPPPGYPNPEALSKAAEAIRISKRPVILAGIGAANSVDEIAELSSRLAAPVATTPSGKGLFDEHSEKALGVLGRLGLVCSVEVFREADLAILVGADIVEQRLVPKLPSIQIVADPIEIADSLRVSSVLTGDIKLSTQALIGHLPARRTDSWDRQASTIYSNCMNMISKDLPTPGEYVHPKAAIDVLSEMAADDAVFAVGIGDVTYWYMQYFTATRQRTLISSHLASMGFALPAGLAAQLEYPGRQVVCIVGDGGFAMNMADFTTAVKYDLPVKVIMLNNRAYSRVVGEQREAGIPEFAIELLNPDFAAYARSCGGVGVRVEHESELRGAMQEVFSSNLPGLVEIMTDHYVHPIPTLPRRRGGG